MGFNSAFKGLKIVKNPGNGRLNNLNDTILNVLTYTVVSCIVTLTEQSDGHINYTGESWSTRNTRNRQNVIAIQNKKQSTYNVTPRRVRVTIVPVVKP